MIPKSGRRFSGKIMLTNYFCRIFAARRSLATKNAWATIMRRTEKSEWGAYRKRPSPGFLFPEQPASGNGLP
jgi:hypothetical protein